MGSLSGQTEPSEDADKPPNFLRHQATTGLAKAFALQGRMLPAIHFPDLPHELLRNRVRITAKKIQETFFAKTPSGKY